MKRMAFKSCIPVIFSSSCSLRSVSGFCGGRGMRPFTSHHTPALQSPIFHRLLPSSSSCGSSHFPHKASFSTSSVKSSPDGHEKSLPPYVDPLYSYSFGRSTSHAEYKTIGRRLDEMADKYPDYTAVISSHQGVQKSYAELNDEVHRLAKSLHEVVGLSRGDVIGIWSANAYEYILMQLSINRLGAIACAISPLCKSAELSHILRKGKVKAIAFPGPQSLQNFAIDYAGVLAAADRPFLTDVIHMEGAADSEEDLADVCKSLPNLRFHSMHQLVASSSGKLDADFRDSVSPDDIANIFFTSGTTGKPKGAATSHTTMLNSQRHINISKRQMNEMSGKVTCVPLPLFHAFAGMGVMNTFLAVACTYVIPGYKFTCAETVQCMNDQKCTDLSAVPSMVIDMMNYCKENNTTIPTLSSILLGAANAPEHVVNQLYRVFPNLETVIVAYGCTETSPVATYPAFDLPQSEMNRTVGTIVDFGSVKIVDPATGKLVKHNETGEIHLKGMLMSGYWDEPEKTSEVMKNGWYATGDLGVMDSRGLLRITGRTKELIIRGGANIYPKEVEDLLHKHENVLTVAVCGVPDQRLGEQVCAWIKLRDPSINTTVDEIRSFCKDQISHYKIPKYVFFVDTFPMTPSGKFQKFLMTDQSVRMINELMSVKQTS